MIKNVCKVRPTIRNILERSLSGKDISVAEGTQLLKADGAELDVIQRVADYHRKISHGINTSFVVTRNINFTNVCHMGCKFCGFAKAKNSPEAQLLSIEEIVQKALEAWQRGASEVCIQGGLHPDIQANHYRNIVIAIKKVIPDIHIHAFSPFEILYGSRKNKLSYTDFLQDLKDCGLGSIPGTAAEIFDPDIRKLLTRNKLSTETWIGIIKSAHGLGIRSTATMMYGHVDEPHHWAEHMGLLRDIQKDTGGFTEFVPLGFVHYDSPLYLNDKQLDGAFVRPGPTRRENIAVHAVARIMLKGYLDNIQVSWAKLGPKFAQEAQSFGVNDLGGTLMNESISRSSGAQYGQEITAAEMTSIIHQAGYHPMKRNTLYQEVLSNPITNVESPLVKRNPWQAQQIAALQIP